METCTNCGNSFTDKFCNHCGQKKTLRITMHHIFHDFAHAFTHADKGIFYLFKQLYISPGKVAYEYIVEGKRKRYFNPVQYFLIIGSIAAFVAYNFHFFEKAMTVEAGGSQISQRQLAFVQSTSHFISKYFNMLLLLNLPFFSLSTFLVYRKKKYNYAEHLTLNCFTAAQNTIFSTLLILIVSLTSIENVYFFITVILVSTFYFCLTYIQFFKQGGLKGILKALAAYLLGYLFFQVFNIIIIVLIIVLFFKK